MAARPMGPSPTNQQNSRQSSNGVTRNHKGQGEESSHPHSQQLCLQRAFCQVSPKGQARGAEKVLG